MKKKVLVGMSGGIDSSVSALLLKREGYEVEGITMLIWRPDSPYPAPMSVNSCYNPNKGNEIGEIEEICNKIGIKHHVVDCSELYESTVLENFRSEYMNARTPNPCIWCNSKIKFGVMVDRAREMFDFDYFATGHYARIEKGENGRYQLLKAVDLKKDQSYFLSRLSQAQLATTLFPLGSFYKSQIREIDVECGFHEPGQSESQDFYGGDYTDLLSVSDKEGEIVLYPEGKVLGKHKGYWHYTIGQRKGLGIAYSEPLFVLSLDAANNKVFVGTVEYVKKNRVFASNVNWVGEEGFEHDKVYSAKIRSTSPGDSVMASVTNGGIVLEFLSPVKAATPGQSAVVYDGDRVIASAVIENSESE